jgi:hypothetical protein
LPRVAFRLPFEGIPKDTEVFTGQHRSVTYL